MSIFKILIINKLPKYNVPILLNKSHDLINIKNTNNKKITKKKLNIQENT